MGNHYRRLEAKPRRARRPVPAKAAGKAAGPVVRTASTVPKARQGAVAEVTPVVRKEFSSADRRRVGRLTTVPTSRDVQARVLEKTGVRISARAVREASGPRCIVVRKARQAAKQRERRARLREGRK